MDVFFFWLFSAGMIVAGLSVILNRNPVASALCFATSMIFMAALFVMLNAFFLAAIQILVTAGAVMVLFLFIIMLLDVTAAEHMPRQKIWTACTVVVALGFVLLVVRVLDATPAGATPAGILRDEPATIHVRPIVTDAQFRDIVTGKQKAPRPLTFSNDDTHQIGRLLFSRYVAPFEVTSLLILVATIGVVVLCKDDPRRATINDETDSPPKSGPALTR